MPDYRDQILRLAEQGLTEDEIVERLKSGAPDDDGKPLSGFRSGLRGVLSKVPGYERAAELTGMVGDAATKFVSGVTDFEKQRLAGAATAYTAIPRGVVNMFGGEGGRADQALQGVQESVQEAMGPPEGLPGMAGSFAGHMAPYIAAGAGATSLAPALAADMAVDVPIAASERDMSLAGLAAEYTDPESMAGRTAETIAESPALRGLTEGAAGMGIGVTVAKGLPAAYRHLRGMGESGAVVGPGRRGAREAGEEFVERGADRRIADESFEGPERREGVERRADVPGEAEATPRDLSGETITSRDEAIALSGADPDRTAPIAEELIGRGRGQEGAAHPALVSGITGAGTGATAGAATAEEDESRLRRGLAGAAIGAAGGLALAGVAAARRPDRVRGTPSTDDLQLTGLREAKDLPTVTPTQKALDAATEVKLSSFGLDPNGTKRLTDHIGRVIETSRAPDLARAPVTWEQTKAIARDLGLRPKDLDKKAARRMTGAETLALRDLVAQNIDDLTKLERRLRQGVSETGMPLTRSQIDETQRLVNSLTSQNDQYLRKFLTARSTAGRNLNNLKIIANRTLDPVTWTAKAEKIKGSPLSEFEGRQLRRLLADGDRLEIAKYVAGLYDAPMPEKTVTLWKAGLLSNPATHLGNIVGNITMATLETFKDAPAALFDRIAAQVSDVRSKGGVDLDTVKAGWDAIDWKGAGRQLVTGDLTDTSMLAKYDIQRQVDFDNWPASAFLNAYAGPQSRIFASLTAGDKLFKNYALGRSLMEQAKLIAKGEGLKGKALQARIDELINTDSALHARAISDAEVSTFLNKGGHTTFKGIDLAEAGEGLRRNLGSAGHVIMPFVRTPANVMDRVLEYSPVGMLADLPKMAEWIQKIRQGQRSKNGLTPQDLAEIMELQRTMVEQAGRSTIGTSVILAGYALADQGLLTGNYPADATERNVHELLAEQPHSLKVDGHWLNLDRISPVGNLLTLGAEINKIAQDPELGATGAAAAAPAVLGKTVVEQSFLSGVQGALDALADPERSMARWVRSTAGSVVPSGIYGVARAMDPTLRDPQSPAEAVRSRLPGLSEGVTPKIDAFGEERTRDPSIVGRAANVASPFTMRESLEDDETRAEVKRVMASISPYRPRGIERGTPEYVEAQKEYGEATREAVERAVSGGDYQAASRRAEYLVRSSPDYQGRDPEKVAKELQAEVIEEEVRRARTRLTRRRRRP